MDEAERPFTSHLLASKARSQGLCLFAHTPWITLASGSGQELQSQRKAFIHGTGTCGIQQWQQS